MSPTEWPAGTTQSVAAGVGPKPRSRSPAGLVSLAAPQVSTIFMNRPERVDVNVPVVQPMLPPPSVKKLLPPAVMSA